MWNAANYLLGASEKPEDAARHVVTLVSHQAMSSLSSKEKTYLANKLRIQGAVHAICLFLTGV